MKKLLLLLSFITLSWSALAQGPNSFGGVALRVNDTTTYQTNAAAFHTAGYYDIYFNNQATNDHWDVWNGSSYDHIFSFGQGAGSSAWGDITGTLSDQTDLQGELDDKENRSLTHNLQTGSTYTLALTDAETKLVQMRSASAQTLTLPPFSGIAFTQGMRIPIVQDSTGLLTFAAGSGVTIETSSGLLTAPCEDCPILAEKKNNSNSWYLWNGSPPGSNGTLTKTDDTNVTLTLGGTPANALFNDVSMTLGWTSTLSVARGGTAADNTTQTYTPTLTNSANIAGSTAQVCQYYRVGSMVTVSGTFSIDPTTTATQTTMGMSLPIASAFSNALQCGGTAAATAVADAPIAIISDATNDRATFTYVCTDVSNHVVSFTFTYRIL